MYPQENSSRGILGLDGLWNFKLDCEEEGFQKKWYQEFPKDSETIYVPASYNDQKEERKYRNHRGWVFYNKEFIIPKFYAGQWLVLRFDAVTHAVKVWINGELICEHQGGFLPFEADITNNVKIGVPIQITVAVDNKIGRDTLPIGNEGGTAFFGSDNEQVPAVQQAKIWRGTQNLPNFDFFNYAGIQRHVRIYTTPFSYINDITLCPNVNNGEGELSYQINTEGEVSSSQIKVEVLDKDGKYIASSIGNTGKISIPNAILWEPYPGEPYLYQAKVTYGEDEYIEKFGIRTISVEGTKFLINGKPFYFKGFGKHEDFYIQGRGTNSCLNVKDVGLLHWIGANSFRTSHYPYAEEMYYLCDKEGIVIIDETPAVGIGAGNQCNPYTTFPIKDYHKQIVKDMIQRDKNHACVVMWSLGNEPDTENFPESAYQYWRELYNIAHTEDKQNRPVTFVCCQNDYTKDIVTRTMDVVCINRYYGWYNLSGDMDAACYAWNIELDFWEKIGKPVMLTEYGADTLSGLHGTEGEMFTEEFQAEYYRRIDQVIDQRAFMIGEHCWAFADYGTIQGVMRPDGNKKGVFTRERRPKLAAHMLKQRWNNIPNFYYKNEI